MNTGLVTDGHAWHFVKYSHDPAVAAAQTHAQAQHTGLWSLDSHIPPWEFRKLK